MYIKIGLMENDVIKMKISNHTSSKKIYGDKDN